MSNHKGNFLFLGTSASMGVPVIGCHCSVCNSESPCNQRTRPSGLITVGQKRLLIDCGPDFRTQALHHKIEHIDGLLLTHTHHDHVAGIDELRAFYMKHKEPMPCLLSKESAGDLKRRFHYLFDEDVTLPNKLTARIALSLLDGHRGNTEFQGIKITYVTYEQAGMLVNGYRFGNFAYISDISKYPESIFDDLKGVEMLVISALRQTHSALHFSVGQAIEFSQRLKATQTWLTHISHELDHEETNASLPANVRMAYDGLELHFRGE